MWITINSGEFFKRWEYQTTLPTFWETYIHVKKQQSEPGMEQQAGSKMGKEYIKAVYCHPAYLTYMQSISSETLGWMKHKLESRLLGEISITSDVQMIPLLWQKGRGTKEPLDESEEESRNVVFKLNIQKTKIMASGPITSWQIEGETMETVRDIIFGGCKITAGGDSSHEIKRRLLLGKKSMKI